MITTKLSTSELRKKLEQNRKKARDEARRKKIADDNQSKELLKIEAQIKANKEYFIKVLQEIASDAINVAIEGGSTIELDPDKYKLCSEFLMELGFGIDLKDLRNEDLDTLSVIYLGRKLRALTSSNLKILEEKIRLLLYKFISISSNEIELKNCLLRLDKEKNSIIFCERFLLYMKKISDDYDNNKFLDSEVNLVKLDRIIYHSQSFIKNFISSEMNQGDHLTSIKWKNTKFNSKDFWFNSSTLFWISNENGQDFFKQILSQIDKRIELLKSNINLKYTEQEDKLIIEFEDGNIIFAPLKIDYLIPVFEILGYKLKVDHPKNLKLPVKLRLSWA
jgi:hypothetical protein